MVVYPSPLGSPYNVSKVLVQSLKGHCIEFKYNADGIHSGLTPPGSEFFFPEEFRPSHYLVW